MYLSASKKKGLLLLLLFQGTLLLSAQNYLVNTRKFTEADGLSHNQVNCFHQDRDGFMWIGTKYGLNRFDGHEFKWFTREENGLGSNIIREIYEDEAGWLWLAHSEEKFGKWTYFNIDLFNPRTFEVMAFEKKTGDNRTFEVADIKAIHPLSDGRMIFSLKDHSKFLYSTRKGMEKLNIRPEVNLHLAISTDSVWGSMGTDLLLLNLTGEITQTIHLGKDRTILAIQQDALGRPWIVSAEADTKSQNMYENTRLSVFSDNGLTGLLSFAGSTGPYAIKMLPSQRKGSMLVIKGKEVFEFNKSLEPGFYHPSLLKGSFLAASECFEADQNGVIWFGHRDGFWLIALQPSKFLQYLKGKNGEENPVRGLAEFGKYLFVNSSRDGSFLDVKTGTLHSYYNGDPQFDKKKCFSMLLTPEGELWSANDRLNRLDSLGNIVSEIIVREDDPTRIWSFFQDHSRIWWIGMGREYIYYFNEKNQKKPQLFDRYNGFEELKEAEKWHFLEDEHGIWIAAQNGLYLLDKTKGIVARYGEQEHSGHFLPANQFNFLFKDPNGAFWLATGDGGLLQVTFDEMGDAVIRQHLTRANGLPSNELYAIFEDRFNHLWISSANGLIQFGKESGEISVYFEEQGITNNEFNRLSYFQSASGRIYFGGQNGITTFNPSDFYDRKAYDVPLQWSEVKVFSGEKDTLQNITTTVVRDHQLVFQPDDKFITFRFSLQDYFYSDRTRYSYLIEGLSNKWTEINGNMIQLSGLPYGNYTLRVRAKGAENRYSTNQPAVLIRVKKPFYLQWWFLTAFVLSIAVGIWQFYNWRIWSLKNRQLLLENMVAERTQKIRRDKQLIEKQAEQLRELDEMKSRFFANISHELRTPLTLILGPLESVLKRNQLKNRDFTLLSLMQQNGRQLLRRINELLDLSSLDANKVKIEQQPVLLYPFVKNILSVFESTASLKNIQLSLLYQLDTHVQLLLDGGKVEKILSNFISNAVKFTPENGQIKLSVCRQSGQLQFSVSDTGPGIQEEDLERVFERFYQSGKNDKAGGSGIGLALSRELAQLLDGRVWGESIPGRGSTFFLQLPFPETIASLRPTGEMTAGDVTLPVRPRDNHPGNEETILVVEDNLNLVEYLKIILENYRVITAENGKVALDKLAESPSVSLIISDIMMPVMDGFELLKNLKSHDDFLHIPVIMLTARLKPETKLEALRIGVDDYMVKPFLEAELLARVENLLKNSRGRKTELGRSASGDASGANEKKISAADLKWLAEVEKVIFENIGNTQFSITQLANELAMSTRRFQQKIKAITGLTPKEYQREIQLEYARRLLESGDCRSVSEVSFKVGFKAVHYFSSLYQDRYGKMPSEYL